MTWTGLAAAEMRVGVTLWMYREDWPVRKRSQADLKGFWPKQQEWRWDFQRGWRLQEELLESKILSSVLEMEIWDAC